MQHPLPLAADPSRSTKWLRRAVTIPGLLVLWLVDLGALPFVLLVALVVDRAQRRSFAAVRFQLAIAFALSIHVLGLALLLGAWLAGVFAGAARERELDFRTEVWWAKTTWGAAARLYRVRVVLEGEEALAGGGPILVMSRHVSLLDVLLPIVFVSARHGFVPRYVAKRDLLWDPCLDVIGHRLAMAFVRRGGRAHDADVAAVASLADDLGPRDAVVIFPEGTRFSEAKRAHALAMLAQKGEATAARAASLKNLLPPHVGGVLAALDHAGSADVVFSAHTGLEGISHLRDLLAGSLTGRTVRVRYWRVAARDVPADREARIEWLWQWWERLDAWIVDARPAERP